VSAPWADRELHLIGVGGAGMSGYATAAVALGARVSGSDQSDSPTLDALRVLGVAVHVGHDAANVPAGDDVEVVYSSAVPAENPERTAARERGLREVPRAALLGELSALKRTIAVAGAHGKTTTSSMVAHVLVETGRRPAYLIGGELRTTGRNAEWGEGEWLVVEADESDRSMLALDVDVAVVTNVELDHHATYGSLEEVRQVFREFLAAPEHAVLWDRADVVALRGGRDAIPFDLPDPPLRLLVPGEHNQRNAAAAVEAAVIAGVTREEAVAALARFPGAGRRFERLGTTASGAEVVDDYAHHPTEVAATIAAAHTLGARRVVAIFQPHLFSRTRALAREFGAALAEADLPVVLDVYPAREHPLDFPGVSGYVVAEAAADARPGHPVLWLRDFAAAEQVLGPRLRAGDLCLVMGAGDVHVLGRRLVGGSSAPSGSR
jgi:UDP-N-acetylmuramate--alanine ligase